MKRVAIFVEGQSELIIVREFLKRHYEWIVDIRCYRLYKKGQFTDTEYPNVRPDAEFHYSIYNVGSDVEVLNEILLYEEKMWKEGYERIVGLRDMYSRAYRKISPNIIDSNINEKFIKGHRETLIKFSLQPNKIHFCFAIMEIETWILACYELFEKVNPILTEEFINVNRNYVLSSINPEKEFYHPAGEVSDIFYLVGDQYDKQRGDIESLCKHFEQDTFLNLYNKPICSSFNNFFDALFSSTAPLVA